MNKKLLTLGIGTVVAGGLFLLPNKAQAYRGDPAVKGPNCSEERHQEMEKAFDNSDYEAWKNLMQGKGRVTQVVNKDNFAKFAQAHNLAESGKTQEADQIRQELGLGLRNGTGRNWNK